MLLLQPDTYWAITSGPRPWSSGSGYNWYRWFQANGVYIQQFYQQTVNQQNRLRDETEEKEY